MGDLDDIHDAYYQAERKNKDDETATTTVVRISTAFIPTTTTAPAIRTDIENSIEDLDDIQQQEYSTAEYNNLDEYVNTYNSKTDNTKLMILETHQVNKNNDDSPSESKKRIVLPSLVS